MEKAQCLKAPLKKVRTLPFVNGRIDVFLSREKEYVAEHGGILEEKKARTGKKYRKKVGDLLPFV